MTIGQKLLCSQWFFSLVLLTFRKLLKSLGLEKENAQLPLQPLGALGLVGRDLGRLGPSSASAEETRGASFLWGLWPQCPADRRVRPRQR